MTEADDNLRRAAAKLQPQVDALMFNLRRWAHTEDEPWYPMMGDDEYRECIERVAGPLHAARWGDWIPQSSMPSH